ncbi:MAG: hypothetical protein HYY40_06455 [Bacteroidetes bacterium]|nr:hypothetical protein [Bacteroidota bacterium]
MGVTWLRSKLNGCYTERYKSGELYKEYEIKLDFNFKKNLLIWEMDRKGTSAGDHFKYIMPVASIDADKIRMEKNQCCINDPLYYETNEAEIFLPARNGSPVVRLFLIDKNGKEFQLEPDRAGMVIFIPTGAVLKTENLPEKCVKVIEMIIRLSGNQ